jgi:thymidine kinase
MPSGRIEVICGCMFSGKTARLIALLRAAEAAGQRVIAFTHALDTRYAGAALATHDGLRFPARVAARVEAVRAGCGACDVIGVDEGQFFGAELAELCEELLRLERRVIVAGIDHDAWGRPFAPFPRLKELAAEVTHLTMPCARCGAPSPFTQRITPIVGGSMVGGPGEYEPRCRRCFVALPE